MRYIGFDVGDGESAIAAFEQGSGIEPVILPVGGSRSFLSAVGMLNGEIVVGERAYTDALADGLSVRFKSRFTYDPARNEDIVHFVRGTVRDLQENGLLHPEDAFVVGCPAGWNFSCGPVSGSRRSSPNPGRRFCMPNMPRLWHWTSTCCPRRRW